MKFFKFFPILFIAFYSNIAAAITVTGFNITSTFLTSSPAVGGSKVINTNATGSTHITYTIQLTRASNTETGVNLTLSLGTILGSGNVFAFGQTYTVNDLLVDGASTHGSLTFGVENIPSNFDPTQPYNNKIVLLVSDHGGPYTVYNGSNTYITNLPIAPVTFYRYVNTTTSFHFYTVDQSEVSSIAAWHQETPLGTAYNQLISGVVPLFRFHNPTSGDYFYTTNGVTPSGYVSQGYAAFVYSTQVGSTIPIYRYFSLQHGHFYTSNYNELGTGNTEYTYEGITFYVLPN